MTEIRDVRIEDADATAGILNPIIVAVDATSNCRGRFQDVSRSEPFVGRHDHAEARDV